MTDTLKTGLGERNKQICNETRNIKKRNFLEKH
jgi:hypothetical protein